MKERLDQILVNQKYAPDIEAAKALIGAGEVYVNETVFDKAGVLVDPAAAIRLKIKCRYVSRGGLKLAAALDAFNLAVADAVCLDIGASSGGFTDCLLQNHAQHVFAVDVAYGQLSWKIRQDPRVTVLERFNARKITAADLDNTAIDLAVIDVSFISLNKILSPLFSVFTSDVSIIALIKPQFELPKSDIGPKGVVKDPALHDKAINKTKEFVTERGYEVAGVITSPIQGPKGNTEFLIHITSV